MLRVVIDSRGNDFFWQDRKLELQGVAISGQVHPLSGDVHLTNRFLSIHVPNLLGPKWFSREVISLVLLAHTKRREATKANEMAMTSIMWYGIQYGSWYVLFLLGTSLEPADMAMTVLSGCVLNLYELQRRCAWRLWNHW